MYNVFVVVHAGIRRPQVQGCDWYPGLPSFVLSSLERGYSVLAPGLADTKAKGTWVTDRDTDMGWDGRQAEQPGPAERRALPSPFSPPSWTDREVNVNIHVNEGR